MFKKYFQQELTGLREIAGEFSKENPSIAPMMGDAASDPDVERLLESVAFLTGSVQERIDDEFPEIIHDFLRQLWPHYLRPLPAATIIGFRQHDKEKSGIVPEGTLLDSMPVDGTKCRFRTCSRTEIHPLQVKAVALHEPPGKKPFIRVSLEFIDTSADQWAGKEIRFFFGGELSRASELYLTLLTKVSRVLIRTDQTAPACILSPDHLKPAGFSDEEALIPWPDNAFRGYRLIQEYFHMPEKFMFVSLTGLDNWKNRDKSTVFHIDFELNEIDTDTNGLPGLNRSAFILSAVPAVNIFSHPAAPVIVDHKKTEYRIRPGGHQPEHFQIYSVEKVYGYMRGVAGEQLFEPFHSFRTFDSRHIYNEKIRRSPIYDRIDFSVNLAYPPGYDNTDLKTLSFDVLCTNGNLPENIEPEGVSVATGSTPEFVRFKNLTKPTGAVLPPIGTNMLWRLISLLTINSASLSRPENLKSLLGLHLMKEGSRDRKKVLANEKRIEGIRSLTVSDTERLVRGSLVRGIEIRMKVSRNHFSGSGDLYLFGMMLDRFFGLYASLNTFTKLIIDETETGETYEWPERIGKRQLI